jgi:molybdenum cofactor biosynthesis enzyme MoaA
MRDVLVPTDESVGRIDIDVESPAQTAGRLRISLTDVCNYRCFFCHNEGQGVPAARGRRLGVAEYALVAEVCRAVGFRHVKFTGGEPLLYPEIAEVIAAFRAAYRETPVDLSLTTNGELLSARVPALVASGLDRVTVSVASLDPQIHARLIKGRPGDPRRLLRSITDARDAGLTPVKVNTVLFGPGRAGPGNLDELPELINACRDAGAEEIRLYPMLWAPGVGEFDDRYRYFDEQLMKVVLTASWATAGRPGYDRLVDALRGVLDGEYDDLAGGNRFTLSVDIGGVRIAMNLMPLRAAGTVHECTAGRRCQEGPYAVRLAANGDLRACLTGPVLATLGAPPLTDAAIAAALHRVRMHFGA